MATARTFQTRIELRADRREKQIALLNQHLADIFDLYEESKQTNWNVLGQMHELFEDLASDVGR